MLRLFLLLPLLLLAPFLIGLFGFVLLPALVLLPLMFAFGAVAVAFMLAFGILSLTFRLIGVLVFGLGGLAIGLLGGFVLLVAGGAAVVAIGLALAHLLVPLLILFGLIWLIRRASKPTAPAITQTPS